jgi:hypothetical protein
MKTQYVLIDYENVQPKDLSRLEGQPFKVIVFVGAKQVRIPFELAKALQAMGDNAEYVQIEGHGRNALDFAVAFRLGELAAKDPDGVFHVISKDRGFDPLLEHLEARGIRASRSRDIAEMPGLAPAEPKTIDERVDAVIRNLATRGQARPRRKKSLASAIDALFVNELEPSEIEGLIRALEKRGKISVADGKVSYHF